MGMAVMAYYMDQELFTGCALAMALLVCTEGNVEWKAKVVANTVATLIWLE